MNDIDVVHTNLSLVIKLSTANCQLSKSRNSLEKDKAIYQTFSTDPNTRGTTLNTKINTISFLLITLLSGRVKNFRAGSTRSTSILHSVISNVDSSISSSLLMDVSCQRKVIIMALLSLNNSTSLVASSLVPVRSRKASPSSKSSSTSSCNAHVSNRTQIICCYL